MTILTVGVEILFMPISALYEAALKEVWSFCPAPRRRCCRARLRPRSGCNPVQSALNATNLSLLCQTAARAAEYISTCWTDADYGALNICSVGKKTTTKKTFGAEARCSFRASTELSVFSQRLDRPAITWAVCPVPLLPQLPLSPHL